jgi:hypothetical protein
LIAIEAPRPSKIPIAPPATHKCDRLDYLANDWSRIAYPGRVIAWAFKYLKVPVVKYSIAAICCFWRACIRQDKPACEGHDLVFVRIKLVFLRSSQLAPAFTLKSRIVITNLFQESGRIQRLHRER